MQATRDGAALDVDAAEREGKLTSIGAFLADYRTKEMDDEEKKQTLAEVGFTEAEHAEAFKRRDEDLQLIMAAVETILERHAVDWPRNGLQSIVAT